MAGPTAVREHTQGGGVPLIALLSVARVPNMSAQDRTRATGVKAGTRHEPCAHEDVASESTIPSGVWMLPAIPGQQQCLSPTMSLLASWGVPRMELWGGREVLQDTPGGDPQRLSTTSLSMWRNLWRPCGGALQGRARLMCGSARRRREGNGRRDGRPHGRSSHAEGEGEPPHRLYRSRGRST
jgi:hypothetical protein